MRRRPARVEILTLVVAISAKSDETSMGSGCQEVGTGQERGLDKRGKATLRFVVPALRTQLLIFIKPQRKNYKTADDSRPQQQKEAERSRIVPESLALGKDRTNPVKESGSLAVRQSGSQVQATCTPLDS